MMCCPLFCRALFVVAPSPWAPCMVSGMIGVRRVIVAGRRAEQQFGTRAGSSGAIEHGHNSLRSNVLRLSRNSLVHTLQRAANVHNPDALDETHPVRTRHMWTRRAHARTQARRRAHACTRTHAPARARAPHFGGRVGRARRRAKEWRRRGYGILAWLWQPSGDIYKCPGL